MTSPYYNSSSLFVSLPQSLVVIFSLSIISSICSCSSEKMEPTNLGRISRQNNLGSDEGGSKDNGNKSGGNQSSGAGTGSGNKDGDGGKNTAAKEKGAGNNATEKQIEESGAQADTSSAGSKQPTTDNMGGGTGSGAGKDTTAKTGDGNNGTPQTTPAAFPGRSPEKPPYSVAVALEMANKALTTSKRASATGDLSAAYRSASEAFQAVSPYADIDQRCRKKSDEISELLESLARQNPTPPNNGKPTIFQ